mmetsp:Transcript_38865/g.82010  ORF Transcript_38865/g.82010 Transcript_38865/m.82010 type:complete len:454 (+) Transcript_38865:22-1383(+)
MGGMEKSLRSFEAESGHQLGDEAFAAWMDGRDPLRHFRAQFHIPKKGQLPPTSKELANLDDDCVYMTGNSLGLQPKRTKQLVNEELDKWAAVGVHGHFEGDRPWMPIDECVVGKCAKVVGALPEEVAIMNSLTVNLHLLMVALYEPKPGRAKILAEGHSFPSDFYAFSSQAEHHGLPAADTLVELWPRDGEHTLRTEDILAKLEEIGHEVAVVALSGVQYYTGQYFEIAKITAKAHEKGCRVVWDCAHAAGNVDLQLHDWGVDGACWCTYKYLNAGPGGIAGFFIHEKHWKDDAPPLKRFAGWWGHEKGSRFRMENKFVPSVGAAGFQLSNPPVLQVVSLLASLELYEQTTMQDLRAKSKLLTGYLEALLNSLIPTGVCTIITPTDPDQRGCQLSLLFPGVAADVQKALEARGVVTDYRAPDVLRFAPVPLYSSFTDVWRLVKIVADAAKSSP